MADSDVDSLSEEGDITDSDKESEEVDATESDKEFEEGNATDSDKESEEGNVTDSDKEPVVEDEELDQNVEVPKDIKLNSSIIGIHCHPKRNLIAAGTIDGPVHMYSYDIEAGNKEIIAYEHHKKHCRSIKFSALGDYLFTGSQDAVIYVIDVETNSEFRKFCRTDGSPVYSLLPIDNYLLASGEDDGQVVLWDFRMASPIACFEDCADYISCLAVNKDKKTLLATSGEGVLAAYNIKGRKLEMQSDLFDCDFLSVGIIKKESKVVVGAGDGSLNIFNWGEYGNISDRFPGHPGSVDCMAVLSDDVICTGCEDGSVRAVQLFPTRFLGVLGHHNGFSVESLSITHDKLLLASSSHDQTIKFWDLSAIENEKYEDVKNTKKKHQQVNKQVTSFFSDLE